MRLDPMMSSRQTWQSGARGYLIVPRARSGGVPDEPRAAREPLVFRDQASALAFLSRHTPQATRARSLLAAHSNMPVELLNDFEVRDALADLLARRRLLVFELQRRQSSLPDDEAEETPGPAPLGAEETLLWIDVEVAPPALLFLQTEVEPPPYEAPPLEPPYSVDPKAQVAALKAASARGAPFCEECEKAKREQAAAKAKEEAAEDPVDAPAQAAALKTASARGAPFCEECEKAKREQAAAQAAAAPQAPPAEPAVDGPAQAATLRSAAQSGAPFCEECEKAKRQAAAQGGVG
jgi:hypothetical protein